MSTKTNSRTRVSKAEGLTIAYTLGQLTQLFLHWMCLENNLYVYRQIPFCAIAGAVILVAIIIGTVIGEDKQYAEEREEDIGYHPVQKTYAEYVAESKESEPQVSNEEDEVIPRIYGTD